MSEVRGESKVTTERDLKGGPITHPTEAASDRYGPEWRLQQRRDFESGWAEEEEAEGSGPEAGEAEPTSSEERDEEDRTLQRVDPFRFTSKGLPPEKLKKCFEEYGRLLPPGITISDVVDDRVAELERRNDIEVAAAKAGLNPYEEVLKATAGERKHLLLQSAGSSSRAEREAERAEQTQQTGISALQLLTNPETTASRLPAIPSEPAPELLSAPASVASAPLQVEAKPERAVKVPPPTESGISTKRRRVVLTEEAVEEDDTSDDDDVICLTKEPEKKQKGRRSRSQKRRKQYPKLQNPPRDSSPQRQPSGGRPPVSPAVPTAPSTSSPNLRQGRGIRDLSPSTSSDLAGRDSFPESRPQLVKTHLYVGTPEITFDWRVQEHHRLPEPDYVALQYYNKKRNLSPFACAHDFESSFEHEEALLNYGESQLSQHADPRSIAHSHLRATALLHLRDEALATYYFLKKVLHRHHRPFPAGVIPKLELLCGHLRTTHENIRQLVVKILDRTERSHSNEEVSNAIYLEKNAIGAAVRVIWEVERHIREYLAPTLRERQVQQHGHQLQVHVDLVSNERAKREHLKLNPGADLGPV